MKRLLALTAVAMLVVSSTGCGMCRNLFAGRPHTVAMPVQAPAYQQPVAPQCIPCCPQPCDPCCGPGF